MTPIPFSTAALLRDFGSKSAITRHIIAALAAQLADDLPEYRRWHGDYLASLPHRQQHFPEETLRQIFATQTYYALLIKRLAAQRLLPQQATDWHDLVSGSFFHQLGITNFIQFTADAWVGRYWQRLEPLLAPLDALMAHYDFAHPPPDALKVLYQDLFKREWRHKAGEYFTPDALAEFTLNQIGFGDTQRLLDPSCGTGTFVILALRRLLPTLPILTALESVAGIDNNPLAVLSAQVNVLLTIGLPSEPIALPIYHADTITAPPAIGTFDVIAGNPPWVNQETLPESYRRTLQPFWEKYGLFVHTGMESILGKGKKDLAMLMTYAVADGYLRAGGIMGLVVSPGLFKSGGAGAGFRRFGTSQMRLKVLSVDDVSALKPFPEIGGNAAVLLVQKGDATVYPVPYRVWSAAEPLFSSKTSPLHKALETHAQYAMHSAKPIKPDDLTSPWLTGETAVLDALHKMIGSSDYVAHAGVYTGGANGVYWLDILEELPDNRLRVRNIVEGAKRVVRPIETIIEADLVYPLLRGQDVRRWQAAPTAAILLVQHPQQRRGYAETWLQTHYPLTYAYLHQFEALLRTRAAFKRYFDANAPFYSMFDIGTYSLARVKVVWQGMGSTTIQAAVVTTHSAKPIMPNQAMHPFVALDNEDEAHYLAACLNSVPFMLAVRSHTQPGGKSFAQPGILKLLRIPHYESKNTLHRQLAHVSRCAHLGDINDIELNTLAAQLWHLSSAELQAVTDAWQTPAL